jgi:hypothetical protein
MITRWFLGCPAGFVRPFLGGAFQSFYFERTDSKLHKLYDVEPDDLDALAELPQGELAKITSRDRLMAVMAKVKAEKEQAEACHAKRGPYKSKPKLDTNKIAAEIADIGYQYDKCASVVVGCEGLSVGATAVYCYLESRCWNGNDTRPAEYKVKIGIEEVCQRFAIAENTAIAYIKELRLAGFVQKTSRGFKKWNEYLLVPRRQRIEWEKGFNLNI